MLVCYAYIESCFKNLGLCQACQKMLIEKEFVLVLHFETLKKFKTQFELWFLGNCWQLKDVTKVPKVVIGNTQNNFKIPFLGSFNVVMTY